MFFIRWGNLGWLLILLVLGVAAPAAAQYRFDHWTTDTDYRRTQQGLEATRRLALGVSRRTDHHRNALRR
jgi:hypothetical protein